MQRIATMRYGSSAPRRRTLHCWLLVLLAAASVLQPAGVLPVGAAPAISTRWVAAADLTTPRFGHTVTLLSDGRVLVAGGRSASGVLADIAIFDPATGEWTARRSMLTARWLHTATLLPNGDVLVVGGSDRAQLQDGVLQDGEIYDPERDTWLPIPDMAVGRAAHTATLLDNGHVLVVGGGGPGGPVAEASIYNWSSRTWRGVADVPGARWFHTATRLVGAGIDGHVLVAGGRSGSDFSGFLASAVIFEPPQNEQDAGSWTPTANALSAPRQSHTATLLPNGSVLVVGGQNASELASVDIFDPSIRQWSAAPALPGARRSHTATLLPNGFLLVAGGSAGSNYPPEALVYDPAAQQWSPAGSLPGGGRELAAATLLPDGSVFIVGGDTGAPRAEADLYDSGVPFWSPGPTLTTPRRDHTATLLLDGSVLVVGGQDAAGTALVNAETIPADMSAWQPTAGSLPEARYGHTATLLPSGKVLVVGGRNSSAALSSAAIYDPATRSFSPTPASMRDARFAHTATLLPSGKVLVVGGHNLAGPLASAEIYDPVREVWAAAGNLQIARAYHTATLLPGDRVAVIGGSNADGATVSAAYRTIEYYDWKQAAWAQQTSQLDLERWNHTATPLMSGEVLLTGGGNGGDSISYSETEILTGYTGSHRRTGALHTGRRDHRAVLLPSGKVLAVGGYTSGRGTAELYDPITGTWSDVAPPVAGRYGATMALLLDGRVLLAGGTGAAGTLGSVELFDRGLGFDPGRRPMITAINNNNPVTAGAGVVIDGDRFFGVPEASSGTTQQGANGFPVLLARSLVNDWSRYLAWTPAGGATRTQFVASVPSELVPGRFTVTVFVNGIPTAATPALVAQNMYVATSGDDSNDCLQKGSPCRTIARGVERASPHDTILVAPGVYTETLQIDKPATITPDGEGRIILDGGGAAGSSVLTVGPGGSVTLRGATIQNGRADLGGAIQNAGELSLDSILIRSNRARLGGGIYNAGRLSVFRSAFVNNRAAGDGGAVYNVSDASNDRAVFNAVTLSGNTADGQGGAIFNSAGAVFVLNGATIAFNQAATGGGIAHAAGAGLLRVSNSILAKNSAAAGADCTGVVLSTGYNLIGSITGCTITLTAGAAGDITGTDAAPRDPLLCPLAPDPVPAAGTGDPRPPPDVLGCPQPGASDRPPVHVPLLGSPAIDAGSPGMPVTPYVCTDDDQRYVPRPQGGRCDIGAYETVSEARFVRPDGADANDCQTPATACRRLAVAIAKAPPNSQIVLAPGEYAESVRIDKSLAIRGEGAQQSVINGRVTVESRTVGQMIDVTISRVTIGSVTSAGQPCAPASDDLAGIENRGRLILIDSEVRNACAPHHGAVYVDSGAELTALRSTIRDNRGGGLRNSGTASLTNVTLSGNTTAGQGGAIANLAGTLTLNNVTVAGNGAASGGGLYHEQGAVVLQNTILAGNSGGDAPDCVGSPTSGGHNLVGAGAGCEFAAAVGDIVGTSVAPIDPLLAALQADAGATAIHALRLGSPALDSGSPAAPGSAGACAATDQRGGTRVGRCDIGAFEEAGYRESDAGFSAADDAWGIENQASSATYDDIVSVLGVPQPTRIVRETQLVGSIRATNSLSLPIELDAVNLDPTIPLTITAQPSDETLRVPDPPAVLLYEVLKEYYEDPGTRYVDGTLRSGLCAGMVVGAAEFQRTAGLPAPPSAGAFDQERVAAIAAGDTRLVDGRRQSALEFIKQLHGGQLRGQVLAHLAASASEGGGRFDDPASYVDHLAALLQPHSDAGGFWERAEILGIFREIEDTGGGERMATCNDFEVGHALLPYRVERIGAQDARVYVYDPNYPAGTAGSDSRYIEVAWNTARGRLEWSYRLSERVVWRGSVLYSIPTRLFVEQPAALPTDTGYLLVNGGQSEVWGGKKGAWGGKKGAWGEVDGLAVGCVDTPGGPVFTREISRSLRVMALNGPQGATNDRPDALYIARDAVPDAGSLVYRSSGGVVSDMLVFGRNEGGELSVVGYVGEADANATDTLVVSRQMNAVQLTTTDPSAADKSKTIYLMETGPAESDQAQTRIYAVSNINLDVTAALTMSVAASGAVTIVHSGPAPLTITVGVSAVGDDVVGSRTDVLTIPALASVEYRPANWDDLPESSVVVIETRPGEAPEMSIINPITTYVPLVMRPE